VILGEVTGRLWSERQVAGLEAHRLVTVRPAGRADALVAVDLVDVTAGNVVVLATDEGAQAAVGGSAPGVDLAVVALVAGVDAPDALPATAARA
jgi:ethanolamine utilization protein EutN